MSCLRVQVLKSSLPDLITLDGSRISSKGIVAGSSFRVPPWREATICWGSTPAGAAGGASTSAADQVTAWSQSGATEQSCTRQSRFSAFVERELERPWSGS